MQITLNQLEIEAALKAYILNQININDGMEIVIDLKATRGEAGTTAIIDIVPRVEEKAEQVKASAPTRTVTAQAKEVTKDKPAAVASASMAKVAAAAQAEAEPETESLPNDESEAVDQAVAQAEAESEQAEEAEETQATAPRQSLFKNLGQVKN
ncbi:hypothetical protein D3C76_27760 [compost metagenome]